ncbi:hypothetical protein V1514DRAFT_335248 [Lipomyces japonicus]|uniref:uncharacterized protein n=1 Tax=Lipomyces japonicus TaxID=56871 RepID=UPI0034CF2191
MDPVIVLPLELSDRILAYLDFLDLAVLKFLSRSWYYLITSSRYGHNQFCKVSFNLELDESHLIQKLEIFESKENCLLIRLGDNLLSAKELNFQGCQVFTFLDKKFLAIQKPVFNNLTSLKVNIKDSPNFVTHLCRSYCQFTVLEYLHFYADEHDLFNYRINFQVVHKTNVCLPSLKRFKIGSEEQNSVNSLLRSHIFHTSRRVWVSGNDMWRLLCMFPTLLELCLIRLEFTYNWEESTGNSQWDLSGMQYLEDIKILNTTIYRMPKFPPSCKRLILDSTNLSPSISVTSNVISEQEPQKNDLCLNSHQPISGDVKFTFGGTEYGNVEKFVISRCWNITAWQVSGLLNCVTPELLTHLELVSAVFDFMTDDIAYFVNEDDKSNYHSLAEAIVWHCPNLRVLAVGSLVGDDALAEFSKLAFLADFTVTGSDYVNRDGFLALLKLTHLCNFHGHREFITTESLISEIDYSNFASPIRYLRVEDCLNIYPGLLDPLSKFDVSIDCLYGLSFAVNGVYRDRNSIDGDIVAFSEEDRLRNALNLGVIIN